MPQTFTVEEVATHNSEQDSWIVIDNKVYDVTKFAAEHPGGKKVLQKVSGKDATGEFNKFHNPAEVLHKYGPGLYKGDIANSTTTKPTTTEQVSESKDEKSYGVAIPYGEPSWYQGWNTTYYNESHIRLRKAMREFVDRELMPFIGDWDEKRTPIPSDLWEKCAKHGFFAGLCTTEWPVEYVGDHITGGVKVEEFDAFHQLIISDELSRVGSAGVLGAILIGPSISLPPVLHFGGPTYKDRVCSDVLNGRKRISLCITEPGAGSDVAKFYKYSIDGVRYFRNCYKNTLRKDIINGEKKWITGGMYADYFTVAARTGGPGMGGISLILVERGPGITTRQMALQGNWAGGTAYVTFEDVKVPVTNIIGEENQGFKYIMFNFNQERYGIIVQGVRLARILFEEAFAYSHKRKTFGKRLIDHPVIRLKLAHMARQIEATWNWVENVALQLKTMDRMDAAMKLGGPIALLKAQTSTTLEFCAREASQIFGGLAYTRGGQGEKVERAYREVKSYAIPGGSEEIMLDLGIRMAVKQAKL